MSKELEIMEEEREWLVEQDYADSYMEECDLVIKALQRLESIENAEPSEALKALERLKTAPTFMGGTAEYQACTKSETLLMQDYETIKQFILKAQEPKQYLKWEDLKFEHTPKMFDVKMNDNKYRLVVGYNVAGYNAAGNNMVILKNDKQQYYFLEADKQLFNDLRLERVEE
jgi:hypothetical protein